MGVSTAVANPYWEALESAPLPMAVTDGTGIYLFMNRAGSEFFRYPARAVVGRHFRDFLGGDDTESRGTMEQVTATGSAWVRREVRRGDGVMVTVDAVLSRLPDGTILIIGKDVTEEVRLAAALQRSEAHLREAQSVGGVRFWEFDLAGQRMLWSVHVDSPGRWFALSEWLEIVDPRERAAVAQGFAEVTATGQFFSEPKRFRITLPDGEIRLMESHGRAERQPDGTTLVVGIAADITTSSRTIAQLQRSERRLRQAQELARMGSWDWAPNEHRLRWSEMTFRLYGLEPAESITPEQFLAMAHTADAERVARMIRAAIRDDAPWDYRFRAIRADGRTVWMHTRAEITRDASGRAVHVIGTTQDITDQVAAEQQQREADELVQLMVDSLDEPIFMTDIDRRIIRSNRALQALLGATAEELAGRRLREFIAPDDLERYAEWRESVGGNPTGSVRARFRVIGLDGASHHVEPGSRRSTGMAFGSVGWAASGM